MALIAKSAAAAQTSEPTRRESGAWKAKHARILAAALDEFIGRGFNGASMDRIAHKAKVSKVTIYNHFENKDLLYRQMIDYYVQHVHPGLPMVDEAAATPRAALVDYGRRLIDAAGSSRAIGMLRLLRADPEQFSAPNAESGEGRLLPDGSRLALYLGREVDRGRLQIANVLVAARQLNGMLLENTIYPALLGRQVDLGSGAVTAVVDVCVDTFLAQYAKS